MVRARRPSGQLFVIDGSVAHLVSDAVLIPTTSSLRATDVGAGRITADQRERTAARRSAGWTLVRDPGAQHPRIWFANVSTHGSTVEDVVALAEQYVRAAARSFASWPHHPRLAIPLFGADRRSMSSHRGHLIASLARRLGELADELAVDVVLVTGGTKDYSAAQHARRSLPASRARERVFAAAPFPHLLESVIDDLARHAQSNRLVLFVGAGVSRGAGAPNWQELLDRLAQGFGASAADMRRLHELEPRDQAQVIYERLGRQRYERLLTGHLNSNRCALAHGLLAGLDPHEIVTTNFDTLMEDAMGETRRPAVLPYERVDASGRWILKLHGTITDAGSLVMTRSDYLGLPDHAQALLGTVQGMLMIKHMLFVGYSLTDDSFHKVVHEVRHAQSDDGDLILGTALTLFEDPMLDELWGDVLRIVPVARRPRHIEDDDVIEAGHRLDHVLDEIARRASDIGAFLLDPDYDGMLDDDERQLREAIAATLAAADRAGPTGRQPAEVLRRLYDVAE